MPDRIFSFNNPLEMTVIACIFFFQLSLLLSVALGNISTFGQCSCDLFNVRKGFHIDSQYALSVNIHILPKLSTCFAVLFQRANTI